MKTVLYFLGLTFAMSASADISVTYFERYRLAGAVDSSFAEEFFAGCEIKAKLSKSGMQAIVQIERCEERSKEKRLVFDLKNVSKGPSGWDQTFVSLVDGRKVFLLTNAGGDGLAFYDGATGVHYSEMQRAILSKIGI